jgi:peptide deformylase
MPQRYRLITNPNDPRLRVPASPVEEIDDDIRDQVEQMIRIMYSSYGCGLSANQVGADNNIFVMDTSMFSQMLGLKRPKVFINPEIIDRSRGNDTQEEGCLSVPGQKVYVKRPSRITLRYTDLDGQTHEKDFSGFDARCISHEMDHLSGKLMTDYRPGVQEYVFDEL